MTDEATPIAPTDEDDRWLDDDDEPDLVCSRCHGDSMDPWCDYLLPCVCQGEQKADAAIDAAMASSAPGSGL